MVLDLSNCQGKEEAGDPRCLAGLGTEWAVVSITDRGWRVEPGPETGSVWDTQSMVIWWPDPGLRA